ncbi:bifunctional RNase H/acid phosphatase [Nonomuraea soli]|uniref:Putative phosphoglycerate mutase n=1 Tax=Nonomuraea soli TaxID=1032476 RepID=A0A7W0CNN7_9ACTN|nr:bifunctional RNase H/acid phosphatase [Nonomuraea soli]MBA2894377.1 putative phosphoglycerate mutase [Nonomuraea soli]
MTSYLIEADGGSRGNPGPAGYGAVVKDASDGQALVERAEAIGMATNNVAEYRGLIAGLRAVLDLAGEGASVEVRMDSKLVIEQMAGRWKIKNEGLRPLASEAGDLARRLRVTAWTWIPRERNSHADRLANEAMDAAAKGMRWQADASTASGPSATASGPSATPSGPSATPADPSSTASESGDLLDLAEPTGHPAHPRGTVDSTAQTGSGWRAPTTTATTLLLLRHGQTALSVERRFSGTGDPELTPTGLTQATRAAEHLSLDGNAPDAIVSSPLKRARQTAQALARLTGLDVDIDEGLRETDFGAWEGHTFTEIQRRWPDEMSAWLADPAVAPPDGESFEETARRVQQTRERLVERYAGRTVVVVSHVTPIKMLLRFALLAPPAALYRMHLDLACLSRIEYFADGQCVVKYFNDTAHLR